MVRWWWVNLAGSLKNVICRDTVEVVGRFGWIREKKTFFAGSVKNAIFRNPSKKMRLDKSFRMVPVSCHLEVEVKSYGQNTVKVLLRHKILGNRFNKGFIVVATPIT